MTQSQSVRLVSVPLAKFEAKSGTHVLSFFTEAKGQIRAIVRGSRGKNRTNSPLLPLFSTYEILFNEPRKGDGLYELKERETLTARSRLNSGAPLEPWAGASILSELLLKTTEREDPHPYLFGMLDKALDCLEKGHSPALLVAAFLIKFLEAHGLPPAMGDPR